MAAQDQFTRGYQPLTEEQKARVAQQQADYQRELAARQAQRSAQFEQTLATGLAGQATRVPASAIPATPAAPTPAPATRQPSLAAAVQPATTPVQPAMDPQIAEALALRDQRRARAAELATGPVPADSAARIQAIANEGRTPVGATNITGMQAVADRLVETSRAPAQIPGERGNYNLANTSNVDAQGNITTRLRQPDNIVEGGYGQFGGGRAAQFLASRQVTPTGRGLSDASEEVRLRTALTSNNPQERRAAREQLASRQALALDAGATQRTGMQLEGEQLRASLAGEAAVQAAQARAVGQQQAAAIAGQYGLEQAQASGLARLGAAQITTGSGTNALADIRREREALLVDRARAAFDSGDDATGQRLLGVQQPTMGRVQTDEVGRPIGITTPTGFRRFTPEEIAEIQAASAQYTVPPQ